MYTSLRTDPLCSLPGCNARSSADAANFAAFLSILRRTIGSQKLLTAAVSVNGIIGADGNTMASLAQFGTYLNYINLMTVSCCTAASELIPRLTDELSPQYDIGSARPPRIALAHSLTVLSHSQRSLGISDRSRWPATYVRQQRFLDRASRQLVDLARLPCGQDPPVSYGELARWRWLLITVFGSGIPSYGISFTTSSSTLATISTRGYQSQIYQAWTKVVPKGMIGDGNAASTDICGNTSSGYNGQWNLKALVAEGVSHGVL